MRPRTKTLWLLVLGFILFASSGDAQIGITPSPAPDPGAQEVESKYGVTTRPDCPEGSEGVFWGVTSANSGQTWLPIYQCVQSS